MPVPLLAAAGIGSALAGLAKIISDSIQKSKDRKAFQRTGLPPGALQIPKFNQDTMQGLQQLLNMGLQGWQQNPASFDPIRQNALNTFHQNIVPTIAERFAGTSRRNSGLEGSLGAAGAGLASNLGAQEQMFNQQNRNQLLQLLQLGTQPQFESVYKTKQPGFLENAAVGALPSFIQNYPELSQMFNQWQTGG